MKGARDGEGERRNLSVETLPIVGNHLIGAVHRANGSFQYGTARVAKTLAWIQVRLFADDAFASNLLNIAVRVRNDPVAGEQFGGNRASIVDRDCVGKNESLRLGI